LDKFYQLIILYRDFIKIYNQQPWKVKNHKIIRHVGTPNLWKNVVSGTNWGMDIVKHTWVTQAPEVVTAYWDKNVRREKPKTKHEGVKKYTQKLPLTTSLTIEITNNFNISMHYLSKIKTNKNFMMEVIYMICIWHKLILLHKE